MRLYVRMRAVLAATDALCIGCMCPVDGPVKMSAKYGLFMSHPLTSTQPKRNLSLCGREGPVGKAPRARENGFDFKALACSHSSKRDSKRHGGEKRA